MCVLDGSAARPGGEVSHFELAGVTAAGCGCPETFAYRGGPLQPGRSLPGFCRPTEARASLAVPYTVIAMQCHSVRCP